MGRIKEQRKRESVGQTLEEFLTSMTEQITDQGERMTSASTMLVDLSQELGLVIRDLMKRAGESRDEMGKALEQIKLHNKLGSIPEDGERLIETCWIAKGQVDGYLYAVTQIKKLCHDVLERDHETKH